MNLQIAQTKCWIWRILAAIASGLLLSSAYAPLNWEPVAWVALLPLLFLPFPAKWPERLGIGFLFGYAHFATCLHWLNEVGFCAGYLLALICALFPMLWYGLTSEFAWRLRRCLPAKHIFPGAGILLTYSSWVSTLIGIFAVVSWVALEFLRAHIFTGFPWNLVGISQAYNPPIAGLASYGGVYLVSFVVLLFNFTMAAVVGRVIWSSLRLGGERLMLRFSDAMPWHLLLFLCVVFAGRMLVNRHNAAIEAAFAQERDVATVKALLIQGDIPQCRFWTEADFERALGTYERLTQEGMSQQLPIKPDVVIWPESAVPAPIVKPQYLTRLKALVQKTDVPLLIGALDFRLKPEAKDKDFLSEEDFNDFNSVFLLDKRTHLLYNPHAIRENVYDKMHLVPFGEYVPMGRYFPWLADIIGMGRDLTPGRNVHVFELTEDCRCGVNICFEDAFPEISRRFALAGANLLATVTNDSWYNRSSGAQQHMAHAIFRAIENRRPLLRSGNNSHTCLILPDGKIQGITQEFAQEAICLTPLLEMRPSLSFYTRHGDLFAWLMTVLAIAGVVFMAGANVAERKRNYCAIHGKE